MTRTQNNRAAGFKVDPYSKEGELRLSVMQGNDTVTTLTIDAKSASSVAAAVLAGAKKSFDATGNPPPVTSKNDPISLAAIWCSGWNIAPGDIKTYHQ